MQDQTTGAELLVRLRATARAEIEGVLAILEASSLPPPKCAALLRAWYALAALEAALAGTSPPGAPEFAAALERGDRAALPPVLRDMKEDFATAVVRCAQSEPGAPASPPRPGELEDQRRVLLRTYDALNRRVRSRLPPRRMPWRLISGVALGVALVTVPLLVVYRPRWRASYYPNTSLSGKPGFVTRQLEPDRNWGHLGPGHGLPDDHFSARYETCLVLDKPATVNFTVGSDDGAILYVDDKKVVDLWADHPYTVARQSLPLEPGPHTLRLDYFQGGGDARISFDGRIAPATDITRMFRLPSLNGPVCPR
jgi:hypothetical protein